MQFQSIACICTSDCLAYRFTEKSYLALKTYGPSVGPKICFSVRFHCGLWMPSIQSSTSITTQPYFSVTRGREVSLKKPCVDLRGNVPGFRSVHAKI